MDFSQERRHYQRHRIGITCQISDEGGRFQAATLDISQRGISCILPIKIPLFTIMKIKFTLPVHSKNSNSPEPIRHEELECEGVVVRCIEIDASPDTKGFLSAIFFNHIDEENVKKLQRFLSDVSQN